MLTLLVTDEEIYEAVKNINLRKHLTMMVCEQFSLKSWNFMVKLACNMVRSFFNHGDMLKQIKMTYITLIPKVNNPMSVNH